MGDNFIRICFLCLMSICLFSCAAPENGGTAAREREVQHRSVIAGKS